LYSYFCHKAKVLFWCTDQFLNKEVQGMDLTATQVSVLGYLVHHRDEPLYARQVEDIFDLSHATVSGVLSRLEAKEFIAFQPDESDGRLKKIMVQQKGIACHQQMEQAIKATEEKIIEGFTPEQKEQFADLMDRAILNLGGNPYRRHRTKEDNKE
jgi:DNA-binding MarR family transcriptional regulator